MKAFQRILNSAVLAAMAPAARPIMPSMPPDDASDRPAITMEMLRHPPSATTPPDKDKPKRTLRKLWIITVIVLLVISAAVILGVRFFAGTYKLGVFVSVILWAVFLGIWALYFLKQKVITGTFGTVLGIGANELASGGAGLLAKANSSIKDIAAQVGLIVGATQDSIFIGQCIWTFLIVFGIFCLPAFFLDEQLDA